MKVLFLTDGIFPFVLGGMQKHSAILIKLLAERGCELTVVHTGGKDYSESKLQEIFVGTQIKFVQVEFPVLNKFPGHYVRENKLYSQQCFKKLAHVVNDFDLVYAQGFTGYHFVKQRKENKLRVPVLVNLHGFEMFQRPPDFKARLGNIFLKQIANYLLNHADYIYSFGARLNEVLDRENIDKAKILIQSNAVEENWIHQTNQLAQVRSFVFIGRNERRKGLAELLAAIEILKSKNMVFQFHFIGPAEVEMDHSKIKMFFHGEIRDVTRIQEILDMCDCIVVPSHSEGMPTVILEAMARSLVVIATDVGAVSRMVKENGILLNQPQPELIADAIQKIIQMPDEDLKKMKIKSAEIVPQQFIWPVVADDIVEQFKKIRSV
ncbi:MAG: glycosyltransferase family 4 protein [Crocinitomicaceae bacterium]|nr:glycosyltransferase family 4 protein [Crocinitomicaceae bacterium]MBK8926059.1 glycosyltransferase family 4 protein [Crocinitomicaceae bacterium]